MGRPLFVGNFPIFREGSRGAPRVYSGDASRSRRFLESALGLPLTSPREEGDVSSPRLQELLEAHYQELRALAERQLAAERMRDGQQALSPTSLLGEAFTRLLQQRTRIADKNHLAAIATMLFVRVLADRHRRRRAQKRGGGNDTRPIDEVEVSDGKPTP
ncbi:MAG: hypothetical protein FGM39_04465 [Phycisphaerales bacterium]|nr:hypothetical protein [Phycisphaerales bacterium]